MFPSPRVCEENNPCRRWLPFSLQTDTFSITFSKLDGLLLVLLGYLDADLGFDEFLLLIGFHMLK